MKNPMISHRVFVTLESLNTKVMSTNIINPSRFGRLTITDNTSQYWSYICDCGKIGKAYKFNIKKGATKSCGCGEQESRGKANKTHNLTEHPLYKVWRGIRSRCYDSNVVAFCNYGGRGISVCDSWRNDFKSFYDWCIANGYNKGLSIDRINNDGNYEPNNCRFVEWKVQARNMRKNVITMEIANEIRGIYSTGRFLQKELAKKYNVSPQIVNQIIKNKIWT